MNQKVYHLIICEPGDRCDRLVSGSTDIFPEYYTHTTESPAVALYRFSKFLDCTQRLRIFLHKFFALDFAKLK